MYLQKSTPHSFPQMTLIVSLFTSPVGSCGVSTFEDTFYHTHRHTQTYIYIYIYTFISSVKAHSIYIYTYI